MIIQANGIPLFKDLLQFEIGAAIFDFHNDYDCIAISFENRILTFIYESHSNDSLISMRFSDVELKKFDIRSKCDNQPLTLDNFYRGRFEEDNALLEFSQEGKSCFYVEFGDGVEFQFLSCELYLDSLQK